MTQKEKDLVIDALIELKRTEKTAIDARPDPLGKSPIFLEQLKRNQILENRIRSYLQ